MVQLLTTRGRSRLVVGGLVRSGARRCAEAQDVAWLDGVVAVRVHVERLVDAVDGRHGLRGRGGARDVGVCLEHVDRLVARGGVGKNSGVRRRSAERSRRGGRRHRRQRYLGRVDEAGEEDVSAQRAIKVLAQHQSLDQRRHAVKLGLVPQHGDVDAVEVELLGAPEVQDDGEELGIAVDEEGACLVATRRYAPAQHGREEGVGSERERLPRGREAGAAHVQVDDVAREGLRHSRSKAKSKLVQRPRD